MQSGLGTGWWTYIKYDDKRDRPKLSSKLLRRVWLYARPYRWKILVLLTTIFAITGLSLIPPLLLRDLIDNAIANRNPERINFLAIGMIGVPLLSAAIGFWQRYISATIGESLIADLRNALYNHMSQMSLRFFTHSKTGELMSRLNNDVVGAQSAVTGTFINIVTNFVSVAATLIIMFSLEWRLTLLSIAIVPLFVAPTRKVGQRLRKTRRQSMELNARMNSLMQETLNIDGALLVKLFGRQSAESQHFYERSSDVANIGVRQAMIGRWFFMGLGLISAVGTTLVFWLGGHMVLHGVFTVGTIVAFGAYLAQLYGPLSSISNAHVEFATSMVSFERVFEILDIPIEIKDSPDAVNLAKVQGKVTFRDVSFSFTENDRNYPGLAALEHDRNAFESNQSETSTIIKPSRNMALENVRFTIEPGELAALVGPSGAGKTTISYLLPRLYDPTEGSILLDDHELHEISQQSLAKAIGMVTQETYLFNDTLKANLLYARPDATDQEVKAACQAANIHNFIKSLPDEYDTIVGARGYRLSGGERQRIAIARVILKDPRILVLDEATSSLDSQSEALIQEALHRIMKGRTSLVIAHRLSTILNADLILVLDEGRIVEQAHRRETGSAHEQLLSNEGLYANLYHTQFGD
ncbi:MAG: ABC transporter ATP-binding protein [Desulfocapsaceae bacterium]|nr:ABC transporter ATP-binding protein [Desulfocapsaceae bacterium]